VKGSTRRTALSLGLGLTAVLGLFTRARGQSGQAANSKGDAERSPVTGIGTLNLGAVIKGYEKTDKLAADFKSSALERRRTLMKLSAEIDREVENQKGMEPGTREYDESKAKVARLTAESESGRKKAEAEFAQKEAEMMAELYKDVREAVAAVARRRKLTFVLKAGVDPDAKQPPNSLLSVMEQGVIFAAPETDISDEVIALLNQRG